MFCFICKIPQANTNSLTKHLKLIHGLCSGKTLRLKCGQAGCSLVYGTFSGFRKHLNKAHEPCSDPGEGPSTSEDLAASNFDDLPARSSPSDSVLLKRSLVDSCAATVAELKVAGVSETTVNSLVISMEEIVDDIHNQAKESVKKCLSLQEPIKSAFASNCKHCIFTKVIKGYYYFFETLNRGTPQVVQTFVSKQKAATKTSFYGALPYVYS